MPFHLSELTKFRTTYHALRIFGRLDGSESTVSWIGSIQVFGAFLGVLARDTLLRVQGRG